MSKHKATIFNRPAAYVPWHVVAAREAFVRAVQANDLDTARSLRMRGRVGSQVRAYSDALKPFWK